MLASLSNRWKAHSHPLTWIILRGIVGLIGCLGLYRDIPLDMSLSISNIFPVVLIILGLGFIHLVIKESLWHFHYCIWCLEKRKNCKGSSCPGRVRIALVKSKQLPKPDGYLPWNGEAILRSTGIFPSEERQDQLRGMRHGTFANQLVELWFNGMTDPIDGNKICSDGKSYPADAWSEFCSTCESSRHKIVEKRMKCDSCDAWWSQIYEIKSITKSGFSIARSKELGQERKVKKSLSHEDMAKSVDKWIFVDKTRVLMKPSLNLRRKGGVPYYVIRGSSLAAEVTGPELKNPLTGNTNQRIGTKRDTGDYVRALQLIHAAQQMNQGRSKL